MTELELKSKVYKSKKIGETPISNPRQATSEKISSANTIIGNLMNYILLKHS